jgi:hypothetical protein
MCQDWREERLMGSLLYLCFDCQDCFLLFFMYGFVINLISF